MGSALRRSLLLATASLGGAAFIAVSPAYAQSQTYQLDIPSQDLGDALRAFGRATHQPVVFSGDTVRAKRSVAVKGTLGARDALDRILSGSGLVIELGQSGIFMVKKPPQSGSPSKADATAENAADIVVTGTNIRGVAPAGSPAKTYSRAAIEMTGAGTVSQFLERVPQNFNSVGSTTVFLGETYNADYGTGVNLRGLGSRTSLTLLNGRRLAPGGLDVVTDISSIPVAALDRVEILPDGASAIYGSDAVAGVVNFVLRKDYDGAETRFRAEARADSDSSQILASQALGHTWSGGGAILTASYQHTSPLLAGERSYASGVGPAFTLDPAKTIYSILGSVHQDVGPNLTISMDGFYSHKDTVERFPQPALNSNTYGATKTDAHNVDIALNYRISPSWSATGSVSHAESKIDLHNLLTDGHDRFDQRVVQAQAKLDGPLFALPGGLVRLAVGYDGRWEHGTRDNPTLAAVGLVAAPFIRNVQAEFAELSIPLVGERMSVPFMHSLTISAAGRHERYSDFGNTTNPKVGLDWVVTPGFKLQASYGTSFSVDRFADTLTAANNGRVLRQAGPGCPAAGCLILIQQGYRSSYAPEKSQSYSFGFDLKPRAFPGFALHADYYHISYRDRIGALPTRFDVLNNVSLFTPFVVAKPSAAFVTSKIAEIKVYPTGLSNSAGNYDVSTFDYFFDLRQANIGRTLTSGVDFDLSYTTSFRDGTLSFDFAGAYILKFDNQFSPLAGFVQNVDRVGAPAAFRFNGGVDYTRPLYSIGVRVNRVNGYENIAAVPAEQVGSWTTVDARVNLKLGKSFGWKTDAFEVSIVAQNIFNNDPPYVTHTATAEGFDPTNANPFGRVMSVELIKRF